MPGGLDVGSIRAVLGARFDGSGFTQFSSATKRAESEAGQLEGQVAASTGRMGSSWGNFSKAGVIGLSVLSSAVTSFITYGLFALQNALSRLVGGVGHAITSMLSFQDTLVTARMAFEHLAGAKAAGDALLNTLIQFARVSPFTTQGVIQFGQRLLAMGFNAKTVLPTLKSVSDYLSLMGASGSQGTFLLDRVTYALGQINLSPKVRAQDIMQLTQAGIDAYGLVSSQTGVSKKQILAWQNAGKLSGQAFVYYLTQAMEKAAPDQSKKVASRTISGLISNIKDTLLINSQGVASPLYNEIRHELSRLSDYVNGAEFRGVLERLASWVRDTLVPAIRAAIQWIIDHKGDIIDTVKKVGHFIATAATDAWKLGNAIAAIVGPIAKVVGYARDLNGFLEKTTGISWIMGLFGKGGGSSKSAVVDVGGGPSQMSFDANGNPITGKKPRKTGPTAPTTTGKGPSLLQNAAGSKSKSKTITTPFDTAYDHLEYELAQAKLTPRTNDDRRIWKLEESNLMSQLHYLQDRMLKAHGKVLDQLYQKAQSVLTTYKSIADELKKSNNELYKSIRAVQDYRFNLRVQSGSDLVGGKTVNLTQHVNFNRPTSEGHNAHAQRLGAAMVGALSAGGY